MRPFSEFDVDYHFTTNILTSKIAQIIGTQFKPYYVENKNILINDYKFVRFIQKEAQVNFLKHIFNI